MIAYGIADDATGALEVGAQFADAGVDAEVLLDRERDSTADAPVVDTETRHLSPHRAAEIVSRAARAVGFVYKKTDSTLRGNIAAELAALRAAFPGRPVVYAPAYPDLGRTVRQGRLYVEGVPLEETAFAHDGLNPSRQGSIVELVAGSISVQPHEVARRLATGAVLVCDGETNADLEVAAETLAAYGGPHIAVGTGAFAGAWIRTLDVPRRGVRPALPHGSSLVVSGSLHPAAREQVRRAGSVLDLDASAIAAEVTASGWAVIPPAAASEQLAALTREVFARARVDTLVICGGDTAFALLTTLGAGAIRPCGELLPGVPQSCFTHEGRTVGLVTKAGGFGPPDVLLTIRRLLRPGPKAAPSRDTI